MSVQNLKGEPRVQPKSGVTLIEILAYPMITSVVLSAFLFVYQSKTPFAEVAEFHVEAGQTVEAGDSLITLVLDDRSGDDGTPKVVLAPIGGKVAAVNAEVGDRIWVSRRVMDIVNDETFEEVKIDTSKLIDAHKRVSGVN